MLYWVQCWLYCSMIDVSIILIISRVIIMNIKFFFFTWVFFYVLMWLFNTLSLMLTSSLQAPGVAEMLASQNTKLLVSSLRVLWVLWVHKLCHCQTMSESRSQRQLLSVSDIITVKPAITLSDKHDHCQYLSFSWKMHSLSVTDTITVSHIYNHHQWQTQSVTESQNHCQTGNHSQWQTQSLSVTVRITVTKAITLSDRHNYCRSLSESLSKRQSLSVTDWDECPYIHPADTPWSHRRQKGWIGCYDSWVSSLVPLPVCGLQV